MDDDAAPRQAPPKPSVVPQYGTPKPVVPEVSLMFDSEDSLIWQKPKSGTPTSLLNRKDVPLTKPGNPIVTTRFNSPSVQSQMSDKQYNPMIYSPSQKNVLNKEPVRPSKETPPTVPRSVAPITRVLTQTKNTVNSPSYAHSNVLGRKSTPVDVTTKSVHFYKNPEELNDGSPLYLKRMEEHQKNIHAFRSEKENVKPHVPPVNDFQATDVALKYRKEMNIPNYSPVSLPQQSHYPITDTRIIHQPDRFQSVSTERSTNPIDPNIYLLIEKQNEHIFKLQNSLEKLLEKQRDDEGQRNREFREMLKEVMMASTINQQRNQRQIFKDSCTQTDSENPETCSIAVNTEISWTDLVSSVSPQEYSRPEDQERNVRIDSVQPIKVVPITAKNSEEPSERQHYRPKHMNRRDAPVRQATNWTVHKEMSLTMQEVVMKTIEEDPPSPDPSVHVSMTEYNDGTRHEDVHAIVRHDKKCVEWEGSPVLGESASMCRPSDQDSLQRQEGEKNNGPTGVTFYNNVMTNIQHILQNSKTAEEEDRDREDTSSHQEKMRQNDNRNEQEADPQMEAVRKQLMQFGISFIDPATLAPNNRPILDTTYLPGLHNMLSMYQGTIPSSTVAPHKETDAMAAKYLTDAQLAAIAAASPAMTGRTRSVREIAPSRPLQLRNTAMEDGYSITTKKFLGKYGLQDDD